MRYEILLLVLRHLYANVEGISDEVRSDNKKGVIEHPDKDVAYHPGSANETVGIKGTNVEADGLVLRRHTDEGGLVVFLTPNKYHEWSFSYTFSIASLRFPHIGGVYLWYTSTIQDQGAYRGGHDVFDGVMAGLEFRGSRPEIVMAINDGKKNFVGSEDATLYRDAINPERLKGVKDITVKVICTHKNFKVELYDGEKILYDSFRYYRREDLENTGAGGYFNITSFYDKAPSDSVFKLKNAQLFERTETDEYKIHRVHAPQVDKTPRDPNYIMHEDEEVRHLISKVEYLNEYLHLVVGEPHGSSFDRVVGVISEILKSHMKKLDEMLSMLKDRNSGGKDIKFMTLNEKVTGVDIKLQKIQKSFSNLEHVIESLKIEHSRSSNFLTYAILGASAFGVAFVALKEYSAVKIRRKSL